MKNFKNDDSLRAFLKKESKRMGISIINTYNTYFSRILLERLSKYNNKQMIVKGSFAQFVHIRSFIRPITDIDLTSTIGHHDPILVLNQAMCDSINDKMNITFRKKPYQKNTGIYKIPLIVYYGKMAHPINIDYRENHPCIFEKQLKTVPKVFEGDEEYPIIVPSLEETLAEKLCIIVESNKKNILNTRVKDFYDIYELHGGNYDLEKFSYYFENMLKLRNKIDIKEASTNTLSKQFVEKHKQEWENSKRKYEFLDNNIDLAEAVYYTRGVLSEQLQKIKQGHNKQYILKKEK